MEIYRGVVIKKVDGDIITCMSNVKGSIVLSVNEGAIPIHAGKGNALLDLVGGENEATIKLFNVKERLKEEVKDKNVDIRLIQDNFEVDIPNVELKYTGNDLVMISNKMSIINEQEQ